MRHGRHQSGLPVGLRKSWRSSERVDKSWLRPPAVIYRSHSRRLIATAFFQSHCRLALNTNVTKGTGRGEDKVGRLRGAKPSQSLKLAPPKHMGRSSATYELPQKIFACWCFSYSRAGAAISRTLALINSASTNLINYLPSNRLALPRSPCPGLKPPPQI